MTLCGIAIAAAGLPAAGQNLCFEQHLLWNSNTTAPMAVNDLSVLGDSLYVVDSLTGLKVYDLTDPGSPTLTGSSVPLDLASFVRAIGPVAHVVETNFTGAPARLLTFDIASGGDPAIIGSLDFSTSIQAMDAEGTLVAVFDISRDLHLIDVSNPSTPAPLGTLSLPNSLGTLEIEGDYLYLRERNPDGLTIVDISDPALPVIVSSIPVEGNLYDLTVVGTTVYLTEYSAGLLVYDASDPASPTLQGSLPVSRPNIAVRIHVVDDTAYLALAESTVRVVDVSDPSSPAPLRDFYVPNDFFVMHAQDGIGYFASGTEGAQAIDLDAAGVPFPVVGRYDPIFGGSDAIDLEISGSLAYLSTTVEVYDVCSAHALCDSYHWPRLEVIDLADPTSPAQLGFKWYTDAYLGARSNRMAVRDGDVFQTHEFSGLEMVDASDPLSISTHSQFSNPGVTRDIELWDDLAFVCVSAGTHQAPSSLTVLNISDPAALVPVIEHATPGIAWGLETDGEFVYLIDSVAGLMVFDVTTPTSPALVSTLPVDPGLYRQADGMKLSGSLLFTPSTSDSMIIFDVSDPANPVELGRVSDGLSSRAIDVVGDRAYVAAENNGLRVFDASNPALPQLIGKYQVRNQTLDVEVRGGLAYIVNDHGRMKAIDISETCSPCPADTNGDGILDNGDIIAFVSLFVAGDSAADTNGDGILDNGDIITFVQLFLGGC